VTADPDDDAILACALAAGADAIVSGDRHLLDLKVYEGIPIVTAAEALARATPA
jgi:predicted nucleic acid-binding protein